MTLLPTELTAILECGLYEVPRTELPLKPSQLKEHRKRSVAMRIRRARVAAKLSQQQLASRLGVNRSAVAQWESAQGSWPSSEHLASIAIETGAHSEWLTTGRGAMRPDEKSQDAMLLDDYAQSDVESRMLLLLRQLSPKDQLRACAIVELLSR